MHARTLRHLHSKTGPEKPLCYITYVLFRIPSQNKLDLTCVMISNVHITLVRIGKYLGPVRIIKVRSNFRIVMLPPFDT